MKETFILRTEWYDSIQEFTIDEKAEILDLLFLYHLEKPNNNLNNLNNRAVKLVWKIIEPNLKRNIEAYDSRRETSVENGKKGGRPNNLNKPKKPKVTLSVSDSVFVSDSVSVSVTDSVTENESELIKALNSQSQMSNAKPQILNAENKFPCIHLTHEQLKLLKKFDDKTRNEILTHFNTFLQKMVDNHKPKDKGQQEALLNEMVTYQAGAIIDALKKAYIAGYQVPYFDKSKMTDTSQVRLEPMQDPSILKRALETS
jgi:hypothetical protein